MTTKERSLEEIGKCAMASIREMVDALECDYQRMEELRTERDEWVENDGDADEQNRTEAEWKSEFPEEASELAELEAAAGDCQDEDDARQRIDEDPLSLEFRSGWVSSKDDMEPEEYCLLLSTGGPATRIIGDIDNGEATSARLQVQDWGTPWTEHVVTGEDHRALMAYVQCFCFEQ